MFVERLGLLRGCILTGQSASCVRVGKCLNVCCTLHAVHLPRRADAKQFAGICGMNHMRGVCCIMLCTLVNTLRTELMSRGKLVHSASCKEGHEKHIFCAFCCYSFPEHTR